MLPFIFFQQEKQAFLEIILDNKKGCNCIIKVNDQQYKFDNDTISIKMSKGYWKYQIECTNGASIKFNINHNSDTASQIFMKFDIDSLKKNKSYAKHFHYSSFLLNQLQKME